MRATLFISIILACCGLMFARTTGAQTKPIKVKFEVDGKEVHQPSRIELSLNGLVLNPKVENGSFVFPPELLNEKEVEFRFISGKYDLYFGNIPVKKFKGSLLIGVDNKPFKEENLPLNPLPDQELILVYYISYDTVQLLVHVYK